MTRDERKALSCLPAAVEDVNRTADALGMPSAFLLVPCDRDWWPERSAALCPCKPCEARRLARELAYAVAALK